MKKSRAKDERARLKYEGMKDEMRRMKKKLERKNETLWFSVFRLNPSSAFGFAFGFPSSLILLPSSFIPPPSSFIPPPSSFIIQPSAFTPGDTSGQTKY